MNARSPKRAAQMRRYIPAMKSYLDSHPRCEFPGCGKPSVVLHHKRGRMGARLLDQQWWAASCHDHNQWAETNTGAALALGWLVRIEGAAMNDTTTIGEIEVPTDALEEWAEAWAERLRLHGEDACDHDGCFVEDPPGAARLADAVEALHAVGHCKPTDTLYASMCLREPCRSVADLVHHYAGSSEVRTNVALARPA